MSLAASRIMRGWPLVVGLYPGKSTVSGQYHSIGALAMSLGRSTSTGPGRPVVATWKASLTTLGMSWASVISQLCLVTGMVMPVVSHSWKASVPITLVGTCPVTAIIGTESTWASHSGVTRLV